MARTYIPGIGWVDTRTPPIPQQKPKPPAAPEVPKILVPPGLAPGEQRAFERFVPPTTPAPPRPLSAGPAFDLPPTADTPRPISAAIQSFFGAPTQTRQVSQLVSPFTGRRPGGPPSAPVTGGRGADPRQFGIADQSGIGRAAPFTEFEEEHDRALEQTSLSVLRGFAAGDNPMFVTTETFGRIGRNFASQFAPGATPDEIAATYGYVEITPGVWVPGETTEDLMSGAGAGVAQRAPIFSGQPGRFSGTRGASLGLTNWRI